MNDEMRNAIHELELLRLPELQTRYREVIGTETRCPNRQFLIRRISEALTSPPGVRERLASETDGSNDKTAETEELGTDDTDDVLEQDDDLPTETLDNNEVPDGANPEDSGTDEVESLDERELVPLESANGGTAADGGTNNDVGRDVAKPPTGSPTPKRGRFSGISTEELQRKYLEVVGRDTSSVSVPYLAWKIREAEKGRVRVGPVERRRMAESAESVKVLPLRIESEVLGRIDTAWRTHGMRSRTEFFRLAVRQYLAAIEPTNGSPAIIMSTT